MECGKWGTLVEGVEPLKSGKQENSGVTHAPVKTTKLSEIKNSGAARIKTNIGELDTVLGGGLVTGSVLLLGGEPGIGKSTLALQLAARLTSSLYLSGEESVAQIKLRAERLKLTAPTLKLANETNVETIMATIEKEKPGLVVIDSVQTIATEAAAGEPGSMTQIRAVAALLQGAAKKNNAAIILIGQVTKDGAVAGPKILEHTVDTVLYLEGDKFHQYRILRAVKNRFGSTDEIGIFSMEENGLVEVKNPTAVFLTEQAEKTSGSVVTCLMEGTRPLLLEIQALVTKTNFGYPQRRASGFDLNRLQMLIAILAKRSGLPLDSYDVFVNVIGGIEASEPGTDLAVLLAVASAAKNKPLPHSLVTFGEVGLSGEVRPVGHVKRRLEEIKKMGFTYAVVPAGKDIPKIEGLKIAQLKNVREIVERILEK